MTCRGPAPSRRRRAVWCPHLQKNTQAAWTCPEQHSPKRLSEKTKTVSCRNSQNSQHNSADTVSGTERVILCCKTTHPNANVTVRPLLQALHWLPVRARIDYKLSTFCQYFFSGSSPAYFSDLFTVYTPSRQLRSSADTWILYIPHVRTKKPLASTVSPTVLQSIGIHFLLIFITLIFPTPSKLC